MTNYQVKSNVQVFFFEGDENHKFPFFSLNLACETPVFVEGHAP